MLLELVGDSTAWLLVTLSFATSALTAAIGAGGGLLMLAAMAALLPPMAVIPVHGLVQLGSNLGRTAMARRHIARDLTLTIMLGAIGGTALGAAVLVQIPEQWLQFSIAAFILLIVWTPRSNTAVAASNRSAVAFGAFFGFLSLFVGATGPLVNAYIQRFGLGRFGTVATMAACLSGLHLLKLVAFTAAGFEWQRWLVLVAVMIASGAAGTWCGLRALGRLSEQQFATALRLVLTLLALNLLYRGLRQLI